MTYATDTSEMRVLLSSIANGLTSDEQEELKFIFRDVLKERDKNNSIIDIFDILEKQHIIYPECMKPLEEAFALMHREDLIEKIHKFYRENKIVITQNESCISEFTTQLHGLCCDMTEEKVTHLGYLYKKHKLYKNVWDLLAQLVRESVLKDWSDIEKIRRDLNIPVKSNKRPIDLQPAFPDNDSSSQSSKAPVAGDKDGQHYNTTAKKMSITEMNEYFTEDNKLCSGGEGTVYKGCKQYNDCDVIVKVLHKEKTQKSFKMELISSRKKHPFLLPLLAYSEENQEENGQCILMYPRMKNLEVRLKDMLLLEDCVRIVYQVSVGLKFLQQTDGNNRDVKAANILLDDMLNARLGDAGIANPSNDVFSLGVVMLQLLLNKPAQIEVEKDEETDMNNLYQIYCNKSEEDVLKEAKKQHKELPDELLKKFVNLAWRAIADDRITLDILSKQLRELLSASAELWKCPSQLTMCVSCFGKPIVKLKPHSPNCKENCARFCLNCLSRSQENPLFCPQHGECQPPIGHNNIFVLMVSGIGKHPKEKIILNSDIDRMKEILEDKHIIGVSPDNITVIHGNADKNSILSAVDEIKKKVEGRFESLFIFYYTGHHNTEREFLTDEQKKYHLKEEELKDHFRQLNATYMLFILDTCYSGGADIGAKGDYQDYSPPCLWDLFESDLHAKGEKSVCVVQWSSSAENQKSYYQGNQSAFTYAIISQLKNECVISCKDCSSCNGFRKSAKQKSYIDLKELHDCVEYHVRKSMSGKQLPELHQKPEDAFIPPFAYYVHKDM